MGTVAVIVVVSMTAMLVAAVVPKATVAPEAKPVPVRVIDVPPLDAPEGTLIAVSVTCGSNAPIAQTAAGRGRPRWSASLTGTAAQTA